MTLWLHFATLMIIVCTFGLLAARMIGSNQPVPLVTLFTSLDGTRCLRPCLFGVRPGQMTFDQGLTVLQQHPALRDRPQTQKRWSDKLRHHLISFHGFEVYLNEVECGLDVTPYRKDISILLNSGTNLLGLPVTSKSEDIPTVGELIALQGIPRYISYSRDCLGSSGAVSIHYDGYLSPDNEQLEAVFISECQGDYGQSQRLLLNDPIIALHVGGPAQQFDCGTIVKDWLGFTAIHRYDSCGG